MKRRRQERTPNRRVRNILISVGVPLVSLCVTFIVLYLGAPVRYQAPEPALATPTISQQPTTVSLPAVSAPVRLKINTITVDATVNPVGLTAEGDMAIDSNAQELAWYQLGPKPGEVGSAVIAGHYGWKDGVASVFNDVNKLKAGDIISTYDVDGKEKQFSVTQIRLYNPDDDATQVFVSSDGKAHLNLITCQGSWNNSKQTYSERLVVFTDALTQ